MSVRKWKSVVKFVIGLGVVLTAAFFGVCQYMTEKVYLPDFARKAEEINRHQAAIIKDLKLLEAKPIFKPTLGQKDAQELLSQHISWSGRGFEPLKTPQHKVLFKFERQLKDWKEASHLEALLMQPELMHLDVSWLEQLPNYDHWNFASHPKIKAELNANKKLRSSASLPEPKMSELHDFVLIYFLQQYKKENVKQGLDILEHAAQLMHTGNTLVSQFSAGALLRTANRLKESLKFGEPTLATQESISAYGRVSLAWIGISHLPWFKLSLAAYKPYLKTENGICAALNEHSPDSARDFLEPRFIFENDMKENFIELRAHRDKLRTLCHAEYLEIFDQPTNTNPSSLRRPTNATGTSNSAKSFLSRIPYVRRAIGTFVISSTFPNRVSQYAKLTEAKK